MRPAGCCHGPQCRSHWNGAGWLALAGSANLDSRSLFLNFELMFAFHNPADIQRFDAWFHLERIPTQPYQATAPGFLRDLVEGVLLSLAFQI